MARKKRGKNQGAGMFGTGFEQEQTEATEE
jgi:hypothetical protein